MHNIKKTRLLGFSLTELMIVIAVVGVLAGTAISSYNTYAIKAKVAEAYNDVLPYKKMVESYVLAQGITTIPVCDAAGTALTPFATVNNPSKYVNGIWWNHNCVIETQLNPIATGIDATNATYLSLIMAPSINNSSGTNMTVTWTCMYWASAGKSYSQYLPANCQTLYIGTNVQ